MACGRGVKLVLRTVRDNSLPGQQLFTLFQIDHARRQSPELASVPLDLLFRLHHTES